MNRPGQTAPIIGLPTYGPDSTDVYDRFHLYTNYVESVRRAGGVPLLVPPGEARLGRVLEVLDGLVLTGGGDIDPARYGGKAVDTNYNVNAERDEAELFLVRYAVEERLPALCICRGMQILNVALGGTLVEHLDPDSGVSHRIEPRGSIRHPVRLEAGSLVATVSGTLEVDPYSSHHQALRDLAPGLRVTARAADGVVEAVELDGHARLLAVQWHPERSSAEDPDQQRLFDAVVAWAAERATVRAGA